MNNIAKAVASYILAWGVWLLMLLALAAIPFAVAGWLLKKGWDWLWEL